MAVSGDESWLVVRASHSELVDGETTVVSQFALVDVASGKFAGRVGQPCRGVAPATAEFINNSDDILLVTCPVLSQDITGIAAAYRSADHNELYLVEQVS